MFFKKKESKTTTENKQYNEILENVKLNSSPRYEVIRVLSNEEEQRLGFSANRRICERELYNM